MSEPTVSALILYGLVLVFAAVSIGIARLVSTGDALSALGLVVGDGEGDDAWRSPAGD